MGQPVTMDATQSVDPGGNSSGMLVEWDLDGNGLYDTSPTTSKTFVASYPTPGDYKVFARLTDTAGAVAVSAPLVLHVSLPGDYNGNGFVDAADYVLWRKGLGTTYTQADYGVWRSHLGQSAGSGLGAIAGAAVPEPEIVVMLMFAVAGWRPSRRRRIKKDSSTHLRAKLNNNPVFDIFRHTNSIPENVSAAFETDWGESRLQVRQQPNDFSDAFQSFSCPRAMRPTATGNSAVDASVGTTWE